LSLSGIVPPLQGSAFRGRIGSAPASFHVASHRVAGEHIIRASSCEGVSSRLIAGETLPQRQQGDRTVSGTITLRRIGNRSARATARKPFGR
jgi:hypothetical protein